MDWILATARTAAVIFAATNIDDLVVVTALFVVSRAGGALTARQIWAGQYTGTAALAAVSVAAALGLLVVPGDWVGLLGVIPLALGGGKLAAAIRARGTAAPAPRAVPAGVARVAALTVGNGGDNVSVYVPVFRVSGASATVVTLAVFAACVALWCLAGSWLGSHQKLAAVAERHGLWITPAVYMLLGTAIIIRSGLIGRLG